MKIVPFQELDQLLQHFDDGYTVSHDEAYRRFSQSQLAPPDDLPADPFSEEYAARYMQLYKKVSERVQYTTQNERAEFDVDQLVLRPFPYFTQSLKLAAQHYTLMGKLMEVMELPQGGSILECGFGWGNTTLALAMLGHHVTALDIETRYCELVRRRADLLQVSNIELINDDFLSIERMDKQFDAVVFFESFHHCWEFRRLLEALHRVLKPGGKIIFGAEPINKDFTVPWGVRLDGESLWVARKRGWMELGFHEDFFEELLERTGWSGKCVHPHFWVATSNRESVVMAGSDARLRSETGTVLGDVLQVKTPAGAGAYHALFGPYMEMARGRYEVELRLAVQEPLPQWGVTFDACGELGAFQLPARSYSPDELRAGVLRMDVVLPRRVGGMEFRLLAPGGFTAGIEQLTVRPIPHAA